MITQATDLGEPAKNTSCEIHVRIKDVNDVKPRFYTDPYLAHVPENLDPGHKVRVLRQTIPLSNSLV